MRWPSKSEWLLATSAIVAIGSAVYLLALTLWLYAALRSGSWTLYADKLMDFELPLVSILALANIVVFVSLIQRLGRISEALNI